MWNRILLVALTTACTAAPEPTTTAPKDTQPNVLLVSIDTLRRDHLPAHGYGRNTAPALTQIANEGGQFDHAYSMAPATDASHATLFTGRYMSEHGKFSHVQRLSSSELTMAEHFGANGYRTFAYTSSVKFTEKSGFNQGFDHYVYKKGIKKNKRSKNAVKAIITEIDKLEEPWFGFLHLFDPHAPYAAPLQWRTKWHPISQLIEHKRITRFIRSHRRKPDKVTPAQMTLLQALYDGQISFVDRQMVRVRAAVEAGPARDTLMIVTSDHGEAFHEHGYLGHDREVYEEIMQVPLLAWWPGKIPAGTRLKDPMPAVDVFPTVMDLVGLPTPDNVSGRSHAAALLGEATDPDPEGLVLMQSTKRWAIALNTPSGRFKYTRHLKEGTERLVRLDDDPLGLIDVIEQYPLVRTNLHNRLASFEMEDAKGRSVDREDIDEDELAALRSMGYIE